jgi:hypothetical protein
LLPAFGKSEAAAEAAPELSVLSAPLLLLLGLI